MSGNHLGGATFRFGAVYKIKEDDAEVFKMVGVLGPNDATLQGHECDLIVDCPTAINSRAFVNGLTAVNSLADAIRFTLKVRGIGYGCEIMKPVDFGQYLR